MDAISLVLPAATIANPGSNGADAGALDVRTDAAPGDFAALLAAGLLPQQDVPGLLALPQRPIQAVEQATEDEIAPALPDVTATPLGPVQIEINAAVMAHAPLTGKESTGTELPGELIETGSSAEHTGKTGSTVAAGAATIAAGNAADAALAFAAENKANALDTQALNDMQPGTVAEPATAIGHPLHMATPEKMPAPQPTALLQVPASVHGSEFPQALSQQVVWMVDKDAQVAELRINPPELGPVEVRLHLSGEAATVQFASAHAEVRNAIESAIARLRESMAEAGIQLGEASVSAESFREQTADQFGRGEGRNGHRGNREPAEPSWTPAPLASSVRRGLVDLFA